MGTAFNIHRTVIVQYDLRNKELGRPCGPEVVTMSAIIKVVRWTISFTDNFKSFELETAMTRIALESLVGKAFSSHHHRRVHTLLF